MKEVLKEEKVHLVLMAKEVAQAAEVKEVAQAAEVVQEAEVLWEYLVQV